MNWEIDAPVRVGRFAFAAIVEKRIHVHSGAHALAANGEKRPILFLMQRGDTIDGIDVNGHSYEAEEIECLYPQAIARMTALLQETA